MFSKDILLIDLEATGVNFTKHEVIQVAAVLLDRKTLKEKKAFVSYVRPKAWKSRDPKAMEVNKITLATLKDAPLPKVVAKQFLEAFPADSVILANYGGVFDINFLRRMIESSGFAYAYDHHIFNLWPLMYVYIAKHGKFTNKHKFAKFGLEEFIKMFKLDIQSHDALEDCRLEAEILRRILK